MSEELVKKCQIKKERGFIYYVNNDGNVARVAEVNNPGKREKSQIVLRTKVFKENGFAYFVNKDGNICRVLLEKNS